MMRITDTVKHLIIINVIFFAASYFLHVNLMQRFALFFPLNPNFGFWQFVTHMFMHGGIAHILFNMYALWAFGSPLEALWGRNKFLIFYFAAGLGAAFFYTLINYLQFNHLYDQLIGFGLNDVNIQEILTSGKYPTALETVLSPAKLGEFYQIYHTRALGASGAIYGVLVAFAFKYPNVELMLIFLPIPIKAKYFIPAIVALDLFSGLTGFSIFGGFGGSNIAHFAHVGGALVGYLLMLYFQRNQYKRWS